MSRLQILLGAGMLALLVIGGMIVAAPVLRALAVSGDGLVPAVLMIVGCFAIGGALMFLVFWSARKGYDDEAYRATGERPPGPDEPPAGP